MQLFTVVVRMPRPPNACPSSGHTVIHDLAAAPARAPSRSPPRAHAVQVLPPSPLGRPLVLYLRAQRSWWLADVCGCQYSITKDAPVTEGETTSRCGCWAPGLLLLFTSPPPSQCASSSAKRRSISVNIFVSTWLPNTKSRTPRSISR